MDPDIPTCQGKLQDLLETIGSDRQKEAQWKPPPSAQQQDKAWWTVRNLSEFVGETII